MAIEIIELSGNFRDFAPLYHNHRNQLRRKVGKFTDVYVGGVDGGTVRDVFGKCWDYWPTEDKTPDGKFSVLRIVEAK